MAVAFDAVASTSAAHTITSPASFNLTVVSAVNGYIVVQVAVGVHTASVVTGCTIGGVAATELGTVNSNNQSTGGYKFYGKINSSTGTVAITVSFSDTSSDYEIGAMSFTGVHQTVPTGTVVTAFGSSGTASVSLAGAPGVSGDLAIYGLCQGSGGATTPGTNETEKWDIALNGASSGGCGAGGTSTDIAGTITSTFSSDNWAIAAVNLKQATTGIAFDAASNSGEKLASSSYNWNHTCTGANRYLKVGIGMLSLAQTVSSITYNSVPLTFLGTQSSVSGAARIELWGLIAPSTGTNSIAVTLTGAVNSGGVASSYTGVHQTSPTEGFNSAQATNVGAADATVNVTTVANNDWVVDAVVTDDTAITVGVGQTSRNNISGTVGSVADSDEGPKTPAGSVTMSWTNVGALATWAIAAIALRPTTASNLITSSMFLFFGVG